MSEACPHCPPLELWPHEHIGDSKLLLLIVVRDVLAHKEWYFHGTKAQCDAYFAHPSRERYKDGGQRRFEKLLLQYKDWDKALEAFA